MRSKSSGDEIANVNFLCDDIVHALQNTQDSCINSATYRRGYVLERRFTKFSKITQHNGLYAVQGHSTSFKVTDFGTNSKAHINTNLPPILHRFIVSLWLIIGQMFATEREVPHFSALAGWSPANIAVRDVLLKTRFSGLHFRCRKYWCIFNHFYVIRPESYRIRWNYANVKATSHNRASRDCGSTGTARLVTCVDLVLAVLARVV